MDCRENGSRRRQCQSCAAHADPPSAAGDEHLGTVDGELVNNPVVRWQVIAPDPEATSRFFKQLFGWETTRDNALGYREVEAGEGGIHGGIWPAPAGVPPFVQLFVRVDDIDDIVARAVALGAQIIVPKAVLPGGDEMAVLMDPQGLPIAISTAQ